MASGISRRPQDDGEGGRALRGLVQTFIRSVGLLSDDATPCGRPLAVSHAHALMVLLEHARRGESPAQRDLGSVLCIDKSNVARLCAKMVRAGHLVQERSRHDGRARLLALTPRGRRVAAAVERSSCARFEELFTALPDEERPAVLAGLAALNETLGAAPPRERTRGGLRKNGRSSR